MVEQDAIAAGPGGPQSQEPGQEALSSERLADLARRDRAETLRDVRHNKRAAQDATKSDVEFQYAMFTARAAQAMKHKERGRRRKVQDWTLVAPVEAGG
jgi:hypothetical protein